MHKIKFLVISLIIGFCLLTSPATAAEDSISGEQIFTVYCSGCHPNGGNIIRRGKNLSKKALQKNHRDSFESIYDLVYNGKGNMSAFQERLTEAEITTVSRYVLEKAEQGWK